MTLTAQSILRRETGVDSSCLAGEVVVLDAEGRMVRAFNGTAARVWELLDGSASVRQISQTLADEFEAASEAIESDVIAFLDYLCRIKLAGQVLTPSAP